MKKLFTNDKFFLFSVLATVLCAVIEIICFIISKADIATHFTWITPHIIIGICSAVLYLSYINHNKNIMKGIIGFLFATILMNDIKNLEYYTVASFSYICQLLFVVLDIVLVVDHFVLNSTHLSKPVTVKINQFVLVLFTIISIVLLINVLSGMSSFPGVALYNYIESITSGLIFVFTFASIVCVESRLDLYKAIREQNN